MKHFNEKRELVEGPPAEFWDDIEYMETMDVSYHYWMLPQWNGKRAQWHTLEKKTTEGGPHDRNIEVDN